MRLLLVFCSLAALLATACKSQAPPQPEPQPVTASPMPAARPAPEKPVPVPEADLGDPTAALVLLDWLIFRYETVQFEFDSYRLTPESREALERKVRWIEEQRPGLQMTVVGHCDPRGSAAYNKHLGAKRASAVKQFLVSCGIAPGRITIVSAGEQQPLVPGAGEVVWSINRRAQVFEH